MVHSTTWPMTAPPFISRSARWKAEWRMNRFVFALFLLHFPPPQHTWPAFWMYNSPPPALLAIPPWYSIKNTFKRLSDYRRHDFRVSDGAFYGKLSSPGWKSITREELPDGGVTFFTPLPGDISIENLKRRAALIKKLTSRNLSNLIESICKCTRRRLICRICEIDQWEIQIRSLRRDQSERNLPLLTFCTGSLFPWRQSDG